MLVKIQEKKYCYTLLTVQRQEQTVYREVWKSYQIRNEQVLSANGKLDKLLTTYHCL